VVGLVKGKVDEILRALAAEKQARAADRALVLVLAQHARAVLPRRHHARDRAIEQNERAARLRFFLSAEHTEPEIERTVATLSAARDRLAQKAG
jgi:hypothetical protein